MWQNSRDRSVITGFSSSAAALVFTSAAVIWLYAYPKCEYPGEMMIFECTEHIDFEC